MNETHVFDLELFISDPDNQENRVTCRKVENSESTPSTRWGHAASSYQGRLYILGGRNEQDIIDLHEYNFETCKWSEVKTIGVLPKPRRRHTAVFVSGALVMFGGFDGTFYNDINILDF